MKILTDEIHQNKKSIGIGEITENVKYISYYFIKYLLFKTASIRELESNYRARVLKDIISVRSRLLFLIEKDLSDYS